MRLFDNPEAFLQELRLSNSTYSGKTSKWVFRGHADASWRLVPSIYRYSEQVRLAISEFSEVPILGNDDEARKRRRPREEFLRSLIKHEVYTTKHFCLRADDIGLEVPSEDWTEIERLMSIERESMCMFDEISMTNATCVAQHHGIPTRLIDWTTDPLTALFFAAEGAAGTFASDESASESKYLCVWRFRFDTYIRNEWDPIRVVWPRFSMSTFQRAQKSVFTWDVAQAHNLLENGKLSAWDQFPANDHAVPNKYGSIDAIAIPWRFALPILNMLDAEGVSRSKLMPTLDNVAMEVSPEAFEGHARRFGALQNNRVESTTDRLVS